jgi:transposase
MMGERQGCQDRLFYEFDLEDVVPADHLLRRIDAVLDLDWLRRELRLFYSHTGRPSVCPELMIRMLLIGYCYSIRSERRLCQDVELNLAYRWFCRLGLEDEVPDHSTFSVNRHGRFRESGLLRLVFESVVRQCMEAELVGGEGFAVDASVIEADASRYQRVEGSEIDWTKEQMEQRPVREYLAALDGEQTPINPERKPKALSPSDPAAAWTTRGRYKVMFAYSLNYLIDNENAIIIDVEATPTRITKEVEASGTMIERVRETFDLKPKRVAGDVAYGTGKLLGWLRRQDIEPHIPVWDKGKRDDGTLSREAFTFDKDGAVYVCPHGKTLKTTGKVHDGKTLLYRARKADCDRCPLKLKCCPNTSSRKIPRDINEEARDYTRSLMDSEPYLQSARERKKIETVFGDLKRNLAFTRLRLRGLTGASDEFLLVATVQNLRRLARLAGIPPPRPMTA